MASSTLSTTPTSLDDLPPELRCKLSECLEEKDLAAMGCVKPFTFIFSDLQKLYRFNKTFSEYSPVEDFAAAKFCFKLAALDTAAATAHLNTFVNKFGSHVTSLSLNLDCDGLTTRWRDDTPETVRDHVALLLKEVKGQVQVLDLSDCAGFLGPSDIHWTPFPRLQTLILDASAEAKPMDDVALLEASALLLTRSVPAVRRFEYKRHDCSDGGDIYFLANVLRNLTLLNPQVEVKLDIDMDIKVFGDIDTAFDDGPLLDALVKQTVRIVDLKLTVYGRDDQLETLRKVLSWIGAQSDWLQKLSFRVTHENKEVPLGGLRLPSLRALEELQYKQGTVESLLRFESTDYFPNLRAMTFQAEFIDLGSITKLQNLRRLKVTTEDWSTGPENSLRQRMTHGAWKLTLEQIRALPEPFEGEIRGRVERSFRFSDLANLKEFTLVVYHGNRTRANLDALVFLSKTKRLQRLEKLEIELGERHDNEIPPVYLEELRRYHDSVNVTPHEIRT